MALLNDSTPFRDKEVAKNPYGKDNPFGPSHKNALADGDELGKGEKNGVIGNATDVSTRSRNLKFNKYKKDKPYESVDEKPLS